MMTLMIWLVMWLRRHLRVDVRGERVAQPVVVVVVHGFQIPLSLLSTQTQCKEAQTQK